MTTIFRIPILTMDQKTTFIPSIQFSMAVLIFYEMELSKPMTSRIYPTEMVLKIFGLILLILLKI